MAENKMIEQPSVTGCKHYGKPGTGIYKNLPVDYNLIKKLFEKVALESLNVDMISIINTGNNLEVSFTIVEEKKKHLGSSLEKSIQRTCKWQIVYHTGFVKLSIVGIGMRSGIGVAAGFFKAMKKIPIKLVTTSEIAISCLIENQYKLDAVKAIAKEFKL